jgi:hypothetical protein
MQWTLLFVGHDLHEAERMRRLLPLRVGVAHSPSEALPELAAADAVLLEDRGWPPAEEAALGEMRELSASRRLALILSRRRGERGDALGLPVVERPCRIEEIADAIGLALMRKRR